ncbi:MAG: stage V sporulation protein AD [Anaerotignum sp.]|nr:stage V sporulation protein AD [Anaerotignum sp.]
MGKRIGKQTVKLSQGVSIISAASTVGPKEAEGPLGKYFDQTIEDMMFGEESWELAESKFVEKNMELAMQKANLKSQDIDYVLCGDLLNQCTGSTFGIKDLDIPFFGLFGACSTMGESMSLGAMLIDGGFAEHVLTGASSHFCAAEKQFRFPLPLGTQRPPTSTWTVTGDGAVVLSVKREDVPKIVEITTGKIMDMGVTDVNNMGAAMAPAAASVLKAHFEDTGRTPQDYDVIVTGDLGSVGKQLVVELMAKEGYEMDERYTDCGIEIFDAEKQDTHAGGSGCACSAVTFCAYFYPKLLSGEIGRMLFIPTGALMSPTSAQQGQSIPGIAHGIVIEGCRKGAKTWRW